MIKTATIFEHVVLSAPVSEDKVASYVVPREVLSKYEVEPLKDPVEKLLAKKIQEAAVENEAFYIVNLSTIVNKYKEWVDHLPRVKPFYAMKCNPNPAIVRTLASLGTNFDCASKQEIQQVLGSGISPSRIIYANPTKMKSHIEYAKSSGVDMMTFDNSHELVKIAELYPAARLVLRIITDDSQSVCRFSTKFGAPLQECPKLLRLAKDLGLNVIGVSFHVGSGCMSTQSFTAAIRSAHSVFKLGEELGFQFTLLDLGGGWPGTNTDRIAFSEIADAIAPVLDELFPNTDLIAEPGRYFVAESHTLAVNVFAKRTVETGNEKHFLYYVNDGVYQSFNCILFDHYEPKPFVLGAAENAELFRCTVFGPTCDSMDCISKDILLPELNVGNWLFFKNMGAYSVAAASPFNGFKSHPITFYVQ